MESGLNPKLAKLVTNPNQEKAGLKNFARGSAGLMMAGVKSPGHYPHIT